MPFKSKAQERFMYAKHPKLASEFQAATPAHAPLPERVGVKKMAHGGPVIEDKEDHFLVHGKERQYKVFKRGMSNHTVQRFQKMAKGGVVKASDGVAIPDFSDVYGESSGSVIDQSAAPPVEADLTPPVPSKYDSRVNADIITDDGRHIPTNAPSEGIYSMDEQRAREGAKMTPEAQPSAPEVKEPELPKMATVGESRDYTQGSKDAQDAARAGAAAKAEGERQQADAIQANREAGKVAWEAAQKTGDEMRARAKALDEAWAKKEIDPEDYWKKGHSKVLAGIGILLSGIGQGVGAAGGNKMSNMAMDVINKQVEDNVKAQMANQKHAGQVAQAAHEDVRDFDVRTQAQMAHSYQMLALQTQEIAHRSGSKAQIAAGDALAAQFKMQAGLHAEQVQQRAAQNAYGYAVLKYQRDAKRADELKSLPGRSVLALAPYKQADELLNDMESGDAVKLGRGSKYVEAWNSLPGNSGKMPENQWKLQVDLLANELGKVSTGGKAGETEARGLKERLLQAESTGQRKDAIKAVRTYMAGQKKAATETLTGHGYMGVPGEPGSGTHTGYASPGNQQRGDEGG